MKLRQKPQKIARLLSAESLLSRKDLAERWGVSTETIKRREREGLIERLRFNQRLLRYRLKVIQAVDGGLNH